MDNKKWLERKYFNAYKKALLFFDESLLEEFKRKKYKLGKLSQNVQNIEEYKKGDLIMFKRTNPVNDYNYPIVHAIIKCKDPSLTYSGYHSINIYDKDFVEIKK